jgi:hypothetical protein
MMWLPLVMGGMGVLKGIKAKNEAAKQDRLRKEILRWQPWTGMADPGRASYKGPLESGLAWGTGGMQLGQMMNQNKINPIQGQTTSPEVEQQAKLIQEYTPKGIDQQRQQEMNDYLEKQPVRPDLRLPAGGGQGAWRSMDKSAGALGGDRRLANLKKWQMLQQMAQDPFSGMA